MNKYKYEFWRGALNLFNENVNKSKFKYLAGHIRLIQ